MSNSAGDESENPEGKPQLPHPDTFLDELEQDIGLDPEVLLTEALPQLEKEMKQIQSDFMGLNADIVSIELDHYEETPIPNKSSRERWGIIKKRFKVTVQGIVDKIFYRLKYLFIWFILEVPKKVLYFLKKAQKIILRFVELFSLWSLKRKILFVTFVLSLITTVFLYIKLIKSHVLHKDNFHFYGSMEELADYSFSYDLTDKQEPFYNSPRVKVYSLQLKPIVVNLKRNAEQTDNPMAFIEFIFEGNSGDVVVELKERESEFLDVISRVIEPQTYESLESQEGKSEMKETVRKELNKKLNSGVIKKVEFKNIFIKP